MPSTMDMLSTNQLSLFHLKECNEQILTLFFSEWQAIPCVSVAKGTVKVGLLIFGVLCLVSQKAVHASYYPVN